MPAGIHAGGLRYHGMSPLVSHIYELGLFEAKALPQTECFTAAVQFARTEGIVCAPESAHALAEAITAAKACTTPEDSKVIVFALSGHGHFDLAAYDAHLNGNLVDEQPTADRFADALAELPNVTN
jgi:tryptophan synthase beta chain